MSLRIRIPKLEVCPVQDCEDYAREGELLCRHCTLDAIRYRLQTWMREKVATATLAGQPKLVHSPALRRFLSG